MIDISIEDVKVIVTRAVRKTISIQIKSDGIYIRAPLQKTDTEIMRVLDIKKSWILKRLPIVAGRNATNKDLPPHTHEEIRAFADKALRVIPERVKYYADLIGVDYGNLTIRSQRTRWGSCSSKGNLNFNCLLMLFSEEIIDSVVVHELCPRKQMNHSFRFYAEVERVFPEYQRCHKWLKENGGIYLSRLP